MPPSLTEPKFLFDLAQWVFMGVVSLILWLRRPGEDAGAEVKNVRAQLAVVTREMGHRIAMLEKGVAETPTRIEMARLEGEVKTIQAQMTSQDEQLKVIRGAVIRTEEFLRRAAVRTNTQY